MHAGEGNFVSNRAFLCRTGLFVSNHAFWCGTRLFAFFSRTSVIIYYHMLVAILPCYNQYYIMAGHAIVVVKDITLLFYHGNVILTLW